MSSSSSSRHFSRHQHVKGPLATPHQTDSAQAGADAQDLNKGLKSFFTDNTVVMNILCHRTSYQIQDIRQQYSSQFGKELADEVRSNCHGDFEHLMHGLVLRVPEYDAYEINKAIKGIGTNEEKLMEILAHRTVDEVRAFNVEYQRMFGKRAIDAIKEDVSGDLGTLFWYLADPDNERRMPNNMEQQIEVDIKDLFEASQNKLVGHDSAPFIRIFGSHNRDYILRLYDEYAKKHGKALDGIINNWSIKGNIGKTLLAIITPPTEYYAELFFHALKGINEDDKLIRLLLEQRERFLFPISDYFVHKHKKTLKEYIDENCSFSFKKGLLGVCEFYIDSKI